MDSRHTSKQSRMLEEQTSDGPSSFKSVEGRVACSAEVALEQNPTAAGRSDPESTSTLTSSPEPAYYEQDQIGVDNILKLQEELGSLSPSDPHRPVQLDLLGCAIADHHVAAAVPGFGNMPKAIELVKEAIATSPEDHIRRGSFYNSLQDMYWRLYKSAGQASYLDESVKYGRLAIATKSAAHPEELQNYLSIRRAGLLARSLRARFEDMDTGGNLEDLDEALNWLAWPVSRTSPQDSECEYLFGQFCSLCVLKAKATNDVRLLDDAIQLRMRHLIEVEEGGLLNLARLIGLLARKYEKTKENRDLDKLVEMSRGICNPDSPKLDNSLVLETSATLASELYHRNDSQLFDLDTAICLHNIALQEIERDSPEKLRRRNNLLVELVTLLDDRWHISKDPKDGYAADDAERENAHINVMLGCIEQGMAFERLRYLVYYLKYKNRVTGEEKTTYGLTEGYWKPIIPRELARKENDIADLSARVLG
jgi:hypothetical protein